MPTDKAKKYILRTISFNGSVFFYFKERRSRKNARKLQENSCSENRWGILIIMSISMVLWDYLTTVQGISRKSVQTPQNYIFWSLVNSCLYYTAQKLMDEWAWEWKLVYTYFFNKVDMNINKWKVRLENLYENKRIPQIIKFKKNDISLQLVITKWMN